MRSKGLSRNQVQDRLKQAFSQDQKYSNGKILSSMCSAPHPTAKWARNLFVESNLGDAGLFQGSARLEKNVINSLVKLMNGPKEAKGFIVSGGTEANLIALYAARNASRIVEPQVIAPESAHFSFDKICDMLNLKLVKVPLDGLFRVDPKVVHENICEKTIAIIGNAGSAELGTVDPIGELSKVALETGIHLHVDAAFGGLVLPFLDADRTKENAFDFSLRGVRSLTVDPHKMGLAPVPAGGILFRSGESLDFVKTETPYLTEPFQCTFVGTRSGASSAAVWAAFESLGQDGFKKNVKRCMGVTNFLYHELQHAGFEVLVKPTINIVAFRNQNSRLLAAKLRERGWYVSYVPRLDCVRIVLMPHLTKNHIVEFLRCLKEISLN